MFIIAIGFILKFINIISNIIESLKSEHSILLCLSHFHPYNFHEKSRFYYLKKC